MGLETITTDRKEEIAQSIGEILKELIKKGTAEMEAYFEDNTDKAIEELHKSMQSVYRQAAEMQKEDKFGELCYIRVFPRRVAILEGTYHFTIRLYDENGYTNPVEISEEWKPEFIEKTFEKQLQQVQKKVNSRVFRLTTREQQLVKLMYGNAFQFIVMEYLTGMSAAFVLVEGIEKVRCADAIILTFGNYLEEGVKVEVFGNPVAGEKA